MDCFTHFLLRYWIFQLINYKHLIFNYDLGDLYFFNFEWFTHEQIRINGCLVLTCVSIQFFYSAYSHPSCATGFHSVVDKPNPLAIFSISSTAFAGAILRLEKIHIPPSE